jgi:hypothetical protein
VFVYPLSNTPQNYGSRCCFLQNAVDNYLGYAQRLELSLLIGWFIPLNQCHWLMHSSGEQVNGDHVYSLACVSDQTFASKGPCIDS